MPRRKRGAAGTSASARNAARDYVARDTRSNRSNPIAMGGLTADHYKNFRDEARLRRQARQALALAHQRNLQRQRLRQQYQQIAQQAAAAANPYNLPYQQFQHNMLNQQQNQVNQSYQLNGLPQMPGLAQQNVQQNQVNQPNQPNGHPQMPGLAQQNGQQPHQQRLYEDFLRHNRQPPPYAARESVSQEVTLNDGRKATLRTELTVQPADYPDKFRGTLVYHANIFLKIHDDEVRIGEIRSFRVAKRTLKDPNASIEDLRRLHSLDPQQIEPIDETLSKLVHFLRSVYAKLSAPSDNLRVRSAFRAHRCEFECNPLLWIELMYIGRDWRGQGLMRPAVQSFVDVLAILPEWFSFKGTVALNPRMPGLSYNERWKTTETYLGPTGQVNPAVREEVEAAEERVVEALHEAFEKCGFRDITATANGVRGLEMSMRTAHVQGQLHDDYVYHNDPDSSDSDEDQNAAADEEQN